MRLTWILLGGRGEEDAQAGLEVCGRAAGVGEAEINTVGEHEGAGPGVQHVLGGSVDHPGDQLHVDLVLGGGAEGPGLGRDRVESRQD